MLRFVTTRLGTSVLVFLLITVGLFGLVHAAPGDPVTALTPVGDGGDNSAYTQRLREEFGLDRSLPVQYLEWVRHAVTGDLGTSYASRLPVSHELATHLGPTLELMAIGLFLGLALAIPLGTWAAFRRRRAADVAIGIVSLLALCVPGFFLAMVSIYVFAAKLRVLPSSGQASDTGSGTLDLVRHLVLPAGILAVGMAAGFTRYVRTAVVEELDKDYVRAVQAKGAGIVVVLRHALRNGLLPLITVVMLYIPRLLAGAVVLEKVFAWPGMGLLSIRAVADRDYPVIIGFGLYVCVLVIVCNLVADILYTVADPRVRLS